MDAEHAPFRRRRVRRRKRRGESPWLGLAALCALLPLAAAESTCYSEPVIRIVPNLLSGLRLACAFALPLAPRSWWITLILVAGVSDWLDGYIARRFDVTSWLGGLLDGFSDKAFCVTALVTFCVQGLLAWWQIPFLLLRDFSVAAGVTVSALRRDRDAFRHMDSRTFGKLATVVIFGLLVALLLWPDLGGLHGALYTLGAILSAVAGADYAVARHERIIQGEA